MRRESIILMTLVCALVLIGIFVVYSASAIDVEAGKRLTRLFMYVTAGFIGLYTAAHFDYHRLREPLLFRTIVIFVFALLILVLIPGIGDERNGARRWIEIGVFSFQPSELAKFALILLVAVKLADNQDQIKTFWGGFVPPALIALLFGGMVLLEKDLGTPVVMGGAVYVMMIMAGVRWRYLLPSLLPAFVAIYALSITSPHRLKRLTAFLDPWSHRDDYGYQLIQSLAAFAQGSIWGRGAGAGEQKLNDLPEAHTDFIFAVWAEEMGLIGSLTVLGLFCAVAIVGIRIAVCARDVFGALLAGGIVALVTLQAAINMAVVTGLLPTKGLPLPFISWGGSSLLVFMGLMGILINIGLQAVEVDERKRGVVPARA